MQLAFLYACKRANVRVFHCPTALVCVCKRLFMNVSTLMCVPVRLCVCAENCLYICRRPHMYLGDCLFPFLWGSCPMSDEICSFAKSQLQLYQLLLVRRRRTLHKHPKFEWFIYYVLFLHTVGGMNGVWERLKACLMTVAAHILGYDSRQITFLYQEYVMLSAIGSVPHKVPRAHAWALFCAGVQLATVIKINSVYNYIFFKTCRSCH